MPDPEENGLVKCVESLLADKQAMAARETKLIQELNAALEKMGYRVLPIKPASSTDSTAKKRGRPPGSGKGQTLKVTPAS